MYKYIDVELSVAAAKLQHMPRDRRLLSSSKAVERIVADDKSVARSLAMQLFAYSELGTWNNVPGVEPMCKLYFECEKTGEKYLVKQELRSGRAYWYLYADFGAGYRPHYVGKQLEPDLLKEKISSWANTSPG